MRRSLLLVGAAVILQISSNQATAAIPKQVSYQGILSDSSGNVIDNDTVSVEFRIYTTLVGGESKWVETQDVVTDEQGRFIVLLGLVTPIEDTVFRETERYLGVNVESNGEINPRTKIASVAYANRISTVDGATGGTISGNTGIQSDLTVSGNVGIGTTSPLSRLHIESSNPIAEGIRIVNTSSTGDANLSFLTNGIFQYSLGADNDDGDKFKISSGSNLSSSERLTITPAGNVGIGTTNPTQKLDVSGNGGIHMLAQTTSSGNVAGVGVANPERSWFLQVRGELGNAFVIRDGGAFENRVLIDTLGNVGIGTSSPSHPLHMGSGAHVTAGGVWTNASSKELKTDIQPLENEEYSEILKKLEDLDVVHFKYKAEPDVVHIGMIAEDVPDEIASPDRKGIPTADAIAFLVAAVKAQQHKIDKLEKKLKDLENK